jgi:hypothetical protein
MARPTACMTGVHRTCGPRRRRAGGRWGSWPLRAPLVVAPATATRPPCPACGCDGPDGPQPLLPSSDTHSDRDATCWSLLLRSKTRTRKNDSSDLPFHGGESGYGDSLRASLWMFLCGQLVPLCRQCTHKGARAPCAPQAVNNEARGGGGRTLLDTTPTVAMHARRTSRSSPDCSRSVAYPVSRSFLMSVHDVPAARANCPCHSIHQPPDGDSEATSSLASAPHVHAGKQTEPCQLIAPSRPRHALWNHVCLVVPTQGRLACSVCRHHTVHDTTAPASSAALDTQRETGNHRKGVCNDALPRDGWDAVQCRVGWDANGHRARCAEMERDATEAMG